MLTLLAYIFTFMTCVDPQQLPGVIAAVRVFDH